MKICETTVKENFKIKYQPCPYIFEPNNLITEANHNQRLLIYKTTITRCSQSDLTSLQSDESSYDCKSTRTVIPTNSSNEVQKNYNKYHSDEKKPLFCDDNK